MQSITPAHHARISVAAGLGHLQCKCGWTTGGLLGAMEAEYRDHLDDVDGWQNPLNETRPSKIEVPEGPGGTGRCGVDVETEVPDA